MIIFDNIVSTLQQTGGISILFNELEKRLQRDKVAFSKVEYKETGHPHSQKQHKRFLERYRACQVTTQNKKTIFHSTYYRTPSNKSNLFTVTTVHDFTYERYVGGIKRAVHSTQKNHAINNSDIIICVSQNTKNDLLEYLPKTPSNKIHVVHNGVSEGFTQINLTHIENQVLFVGQRGGYKNFSSAIYALSMVKDIRISCVGGGSFTKSELAFLEKNIPGRYAHLGYITEEQLNKEYNKSIALIYPSLYEGFGIPILEAMRAGCPVISGHNSSIPEVAGDSALLLERGSPDEIKDALNSLSNKELREKLISQGLVQSNKFSWERTFTETLALYQTLLPYPLLNSAID